MPARLVPHPPVGPPPLHLLLTAANTAVDHAWQAIEHALNEGLTEVALTLAWQGLDRVANAIHLCEVVAAFAAEVEDDNAEMEDDNAEMEDDNAEMEADDVGSDHEADEIEAFVNFLEDDDETDEDPVLPTGGEGNRARH
jgi:hypothetical protein